MCKKLIFLVFCVSVLFSGAVMAEVDDSGRLIVPETFVAPVIDGELDDVWQNIGEESLLVTEIINLTVACYAVSGPAHRFLIPWTLTMPLYFPLGTIASYKALYELLIKPFYWDKTQHGLSQPDAKRLWSPIFQPSASRWSAS